MLSFYEYLMEHAPIASSSTTQVLTNTGTVKKAGEFMRKEGVNGTVLHHGAGANVTEKHNTLLSPKGDGSDVESYEPFPNKHVKEKPTYTKEEDVPRRHYHGVVSTSVINVIPNDNGERDHYVRHVGNSLKPGGVGLVSARHIKDVETAKTKRPHESEKGAYWIPKKDPETKQKVNVFQKGFTHDEFHKYMSDTLGDKFHVEKSKALNGVCVKVTRKK